MRTFDLRRARSPILATCCAWVMALAAQAESLDTERAYLAGNAAAMARMDAGMAARPTGDVDADFAAMMIPHHQGAIDMAVLEIRYGRNEQLRRIAQEIVVDQQQEIAAMRMALGQALPPSAPAPTQPGMTPPRPAARPDHAAMEMKP
jgi:uncharacterized protein (DUF305 family)